MTTIFNPPFGASINSTISGAQTISGLSLNIQYFDSITVVGSLSVPQNIYLYSGSYIYLAGGTVNATDIWGVGAVSNGIISPGGVIQGNGTVNASLSSLVGVNAQGGLLKIAGTLSDNTGNGSGSYYEVQNGSILELNSPTAYTGSLIFSGNSGIIKLDTPSQFRGVIVGMQIGDTLDLAGVSATSAYFNNNSILTINESNGQSLSYSFNAQTLSSNGGNLVTALVNATPDGNGGTNITWSTSQTPSSGSIATFLSNVNSLGNQSFTVQDNSVNIFSNLDTLQADLGKIAAIQVIDNGQTGITIAQFTNDSGALNLMSGNYSINVFGLTALQLSNVLSNTHVHVVGVQDTSTNLVANLDLLQSDITKLNQVLVSDASPLHVTQLQATNDAGVLSLIQQAGGSFVIGGINPNPSSNSGNISTFLSNVNSLGNQSFTVQDNSVNIFSNLDTLQADLGKIAAIQVIDNGQTGITIAQFTNDSGALNLMSGNYSINVFGLTALQLSNVLSNTHVHVVGVQDTSTNLVANLDLLQSDITKLNQVLVSDASPLHVTQLQATNDAGVLSLIQQAGGSFVIGQNLNSPVTIGINSTYTATPNQTITGSSGVEKVVFNEPSSNFKITISGSTATMVDGGGSYGTNTLNNIQRLQFTDTNIALDIAPNQTAGSVYMLYQATFNRTPDAAGLGYWIAQVDKGANIITNVAASFVTSPEFVAKYGSNPSNASYVDNLYQNVLHRAGESGGVAYWNQQLNTGAATKAFVLEQFATLAEGAALVAPTIAHGIAYTQWVG